MKAFVFDLDGTLLNSLDDIADSANQVLINNLYPHHKTSLYKTFVGDGLVTLFQRICPQGADDATIHQLCDQFKDVYEQCWHKKSHLYPGIEEMLESLQEAGAILGVLSNKPHQFTVQCVEHFFPAGLFQIYYGQRENIQKKPDPAGLKEIARELSLPLSKLVYIGDSSVDMQTGRNAGVLTVGVDWGFRSVDELKRHGAHNIINQPHELLSFVDDNKT